ncbi:MAG: InlB B-repeat-containing protein [Clostridia bacterium]|nr:InlB B-repeat-containing protein [Clostridia bacterium]
MKTKIISVFLALILMFSAVIIPSTVAYAESEDTTPPKILTETLTVSHNKVITGDSVRASVVITDDSFVQEAFIFYESPESQNIYYMPMLKNINTGRFIVDMPIDNYTECGKWTAICIAAVDENGNEIIVGDYDNVDIEADMSAADFEVINVFSNGEPPHDYRITVDQTLQLEIESKTEIKWSVSDESLADITDVNFGYDYDYSTRLYKGSCTVVPKKTGLVDVYAEDKDGNLVAGARVLVVKSVEYFKVYLDYQGGRVDYEYIEVPVGYALELPSTYKSGYSFAGWSRNPDAKKAEYHTHIYYVPDNDVTLYAVFTKQEGSNGSAPYELKLNLNYGDESPETVIFETSRRYTLPTPQREGYTCVGWSYQKYAVVPSLKCGSEINVNNDTTVYAVWVKDGIEERCDYVIELHETAKIEFSSYFEVDRWISADETVATFGKKGEFGVNSDTGEINYFCNINPKSPGTTVFYALDENNGIVAAFRVLIKESTLMCRVNFDANGGEVDSPYGETFYGTSITIPTPVREGYVCKGWSKNKDAQKADCYCGSSYVVTKDETLYAVWVAESDIFYTIGFDPNEGTIENMMQTVPYGDSIILPTPVREGYTCIGWKEMMLGDEPDYPCGAVYTPNSHMVFFAVWKENSDIVLGDINKDGRINSLDALLVLNYAVKNITFNSEELVAADVNKDSQINSLDALMILMYSVGHIESF